jgi:hypothetical protein
MECINLDVSKDVKKLKNIKLGTKEFDKKIIDILLKIGGNLAEKSYDNSQLLLFKSIVPSQDNETYHDIADLVFERYFIRYNERKRLEKTSH